MRLLHSFQKAIASLFGHPPLQCHKTDYDQYWQSKRPGILGTLNSFQLFRAEWALSRISPDSSVLDIGCGDGAILQYMNRQKSLTVYGADYSDLALRYLASCGIEVIKLDTNAANCASSIPVVDHILLFEILEHMPDPEAFLLSVIEKARRSVFVGIPNSGYWLHRLRFLLGRFPVQWRVHPGEHVRFWTQADLRWWLNELGFSSCRNIAVYEGIPVLNRIWGSMFGRGFIFEINSPRQ